MLKAPFPYFGGKSQVADVVWTALGDVKHYIEPFFGSGAVLLARKNYDPTKHIETVCDKDGFLANVWRALQSAPDEVAKYCDWPVNHADLSARRTKLVLREKYLLENLISDDKFFDAELAGYWIWAASGGIGANMMSLGKNPHNRVHSLGQIPHIGDGGVGVHSLGTRPHIRNSERGVQDIYNDNIYKWFRELSERLRYVRVVCGDWTRVCGGNWQDKRGTVGIFFDPPYGYKNRSVVYTHDSYDIAAQVEEWCLSRGRKDTYRIVCAGYEGEYPKLIDDGWEIYRWKTTGGYSNIGNRQTQGKENRHKEMLLFSPHCLKTCGAGLV